MSDPTLAYAILGSIIALILAAIVYLQTVAKQDVGEEDAPSQQPVVRRGQAGNRAAANRNARARMRAVLAERRGEELPPEEEEQVAPRQQQHHDEEDDSENEDSEGSSLPKGKIGKKKAAKLQAKAEKREQRLAEEREREEKKERDALKAAEEKEREEAEAAEEEKRLAEEKKLQEEREKREQEEYEKMKVMFSVEESGFDQNPDDEAEKDLLREFVAFIKREKVVVMEELAARFRLKTQAVINRVNDLQAEGTLTGVLDDRGKFIYISRTELEAFATFIRQRGRVTLAELAEASGTLVSLTPDSDVAEQVAVEG